MEVDNCEKRAGVVEAPSVSFPTGHPLEGTTVSRDNKTGKIFSVCNDFFIILYENDTKISVYFITRQIEKQLCTCIFKLRDFSLQ